MCVCVCGLPTHQAFLVILKAATGDPAIAPSEVDAAKKFVDSDTSSTHLREGLQTKGVGGALHSDSDAIVVKGVMDDSLDGDFQLFIEAMFSPGMPTIANEDETLLLTSPSVVSVDRDKSSIVSVLTQSIEDIAGIMKGWSPKRVSEELDALKGLLTQAAMCVVAFDGVRMQETAQAWAKYLENWSTTVSHPDSDSEWPPQGALKVDQELVQTSESCLLPLPSLLATLASTIEQNARFCLELAQSVAAVQSKYDAWVHNKAFRDIVWKEFYAIMGAFKFPSKPPAEAIAEFIAGDDCFMSCLVKVAECRLEMQQLPDAQGQFFVQVGEDEAWSRASLSEFVSKSRTGSSSVVMISKHLVPMVQQAGKAFREQFICSTAAAWTMPLDSWQAPDMTSEVGFVKIFGKAKLTKAITAMKEMFDVVVADAAIENVTETVDAINECMELTSSWKLLKRAIAAVPPMYDYSLPYLVTDGAKVPVPTIFAMGDALVFLESSLLMAASIIEFLKDLAEKNLSSQPAARRFLPLIVGVTNDLQQRVERWPPMKDNLLSFPQVDNMVCKTSDLDSGMQHLAGFLTKGREELKVVVVLRRVGSWWWGAELVVVWLSALDPRSASASPQRLPKAQRVIRGYAPLLDG